MIWSSKGHEFDEYEKNFCRRKIYIYGAGKKGRELYEKLSLISGIEGYIDRNKDLQSVVKCKVINFEEFAHLNWKEYIVVLAASDIHMGLFAKQLLMLGLKEGKDFFHYDSFLDYWIYIYAFYGCGKVYAPFISFQVTNVCNLRCKGCAGFTEVRDKWEHYSLDMISRDLENMFKVIDVIDLLDVCGGEPTLFKQYPDAVKMISKHRKRINTLRTVINGTFVPNDDFCNAVKDADMLVIIDDYRASVTSCGDTFDAIRNKFDDMGIRYCIRNNSSWIKLLENDLIHESDEDAIIFFNKCANKVRSIHNNKLYLCDYAHYASDSGIIDSDANDYLILDQCNNKAEVLEFLMGYSDNGFLNMCKRCNGYVTINQNKIPVASQLYNVSED